MNDSIKFLNLKEEDVKILPSHIENNVMFVNITLIRKEIEYLNC